MYRTVLCFVFFIFLFGCAANQDILYLDSRIQELEKNQQSMLQEKTDKIDEIDKISKQEILDLREKYAKLSVDVDKIKEDLSLLNGKFDEKVYEINSKLKQNSDANVENSFKRFDHQLTLNMDRLIQLEEYMGFEPSKDVGIKNPAAESKQSTAISDPNSLDEKELYKFAKKTFDENKKEKAKELFQNFVKKYPKSKNADNAIFWIGEIYYSEKWYEKAILEYQIVIEKYPKGNKVPAALLKQGYAFHKIGEKNNASLVLKELIKKFPQSNEAKIAQRKLKEL